MKKEYKGYSARVEFDEEAGVLFGEVDGLRDVVTFEATNVADLEQEFHASVDEYLAMCAEKGEEPDKPYSGKFVVRLDPGIHRRIAMAAAKTGQSLNALTSEALVRWLESQVRPAQARVPPPNVNQPEAKGFNVIPQSKPQDAAAVALDAGPGLWSQAPKNTPGAFRTPQTPSSQTPKLEKVA